MLAALDLSKCLLSNLKYVLTVIKHFFLNVECACTLIKHGGTNCLFAPALVER